MIKSIKNKHGFWLRIPSKISRTYFHILAMGNGLAEILPARVYTVSALKDRQSLSFKDAAKRRAAIAAGNKVQY